LPTEAEIEFATRAGAQTSRYFGESEELLPHYAWFNKNSEAKRSPVGWLMPNDFGLFDLQGNVFTWCQESYKEYPRGEKIFEDKEDGPTIDLKSDRVVRGGTYGSPALFVRSAQRDRFAPNFPNGAGFGFRPARTLPPTHPKEYEKRRPGPEPPFPGPALANALVS
jgi:formylglycine-generating enzyme required for sulfatase activity